jgi:hypothetical protein
LVPAPLGGKPVAAFPVFLTIIIGVPTHLDHDVLVFSKKAGSSGYWEPFFKAFVLYFRP